MRSLCLIAFRNLFRHRVRSLLTALSIMSSIGLLFLVLCFGNGIRDQLIGNLVNLETGALYCQFKDSFFTLPAEQQNRLFSEVQTYLQSRPEVLRLRPRLSLKGFIYYNNRSANVTIKGIVPGNEEVIRKTLRLEATQFLRTDQKAEVVISRSVADRLGAAIGTDVTILTHTKDGSLNLVDLRVAGIFENLAPWVDGTIYTDLESATRLYNVSLPKELIVDLKSLEMAGRIKSELGRALPFLSENYISLASYRSRSGIAASIANINTYSMLGFVSCILIIVAVGVSTVIITSVHERQVEIGTLLAIGFQPQKVTLMFVLEMVFLWLLSALLAVTLGSLCVLLLSHRGIDVGETASLAFGSRRLIPTWSTASVLIVVGVGFVLSVTSSFIPSKNAAKLNPIEALRQM